MSVETPNIHLLDDVVADRILRAMRVADEMLTRAGVTHALCGGLAVGAHGFPRATKDVDFLVSDEAFVVHGGGVVTMAGGVPIQINGVAIDHLSVQPDEPFLKEALLHSVETGGIRVVPIEALVFMKLKSPRPKDRLDLLQLVRAGLDLDACRELVATHAPKLSPKWQAIVDEAWTGDE